MNPSDRFTELAGLQILARQMLDAGAHGVLPDEPADERVARRELGLSFLISFAVHFCLLLAMSFVIYQADGFAGRQQSVQTVLARTADDWPREEFAPIELLEREPEPEPLLVSPAPALEPSFAEVMTRPVEMDLPMAAIEPAAERRPAAPPASPPMKPDKGTKKANQRPPGKVGGQTMGDRDGGPPPNREAWMANQLVGRKGPLKGKLIRKMGGTDSSERAVGLGLKWLQAHQSTDGGWSFHHVLHVRCDCESPGMLSECRSAATGMALLCFLGAGHTHEEGDYIPEVRAGLEFLTQRGRKLGKGMVFAEAQGLIGNGTFYAHALSTIALAEALAMTEDQSLRPLVEDAVQFLVDTQNPTTGGWRYTAGDPGDTSVVAWQVMALKSAQFSRVSVPPKTLALAEHFLAQVTRDRGTVYAYQPGRQPTPSMTAAGLLSRLYLGTPRNQPLIKEGARRLAQFGPSPDDMYYNFYATQVLHHQGGREWEDWNERMRNALVRSQQQEGHATGSWDVTDPHGHSGGRLYQTALSILTLEVYYRHLPLNQTDRFLAEME